MLIFSTKLYVTNELTDEKFIDLAIEWISGGQNYTFGEVKWDGKEEFTIENANCTQKFTIMKYESAVIVNLVNKDGKIIWTNDFVLTEKDGKRVLAVLLYNDAVDMSARLPKEFNRPRLLKRIIRDKYGADDNGLKINDEPMVIRKENLKVAEEIILGKKEYFMPVVYVTPALDTSTYRLDYKELAKDLAGVAHVLVEENSECTKVLRELVDGKNPYNGAVQIYYSASITQRILPGSFSNIHEFRKEVAYSVFRKLILSRINDEYSWTKIRYENLMKKSKKSMELAEICNQLIDEYEGKIDAGNQQIQELEDKINELQGKIGAYEYRFKKKNEQRGVISFDIQEMDLYDDEIKDVILKVLTEAAQKMDTDPNLRESRKYHVLKSITQQNKLTGKDKEIEKSLRAILNGDGSFNKSKKRQLNELGFEIEEGKHYKIRYHGDKRYMITLVKTGSDFRGNKNAVSIALNVLFGY